MTEPTAAPVLIERRAGLIKLVLNRSRVLNSLTPEMICLLRRGLDLALKDEACRLLVFAGRGERGFCAGGDLKKLGLMVRQGEFQRMAQFFREEYDLDLQLHEWTR